MGKGSGVCTRPSMQLAAAMKQSGSSSSAANATQQVPAGEVEKQAFVDEQAKRDLVLVLQSILQAASQYKSSSLDKLTWRPTRDYYSNDEAKVWSVLLQAYKQDDGWRLNIADDYLNQYLEEYGFTKNINEPSHVVLSTLAEVRELLKEIYSRVDAKPPKIGKAKDWQSTNNYYIAKRAFRPYGGVWWRASVAEEHPLKPILQAYEKAVKPISEASKGEGSYVLLAEQADYAYGKTRIEAVRKLETSLEKHYPKYMKTISK